MDFVNLNFVKGILARSNLCGLSMRTGHCEFLRLKRGELRKMKMEVEKKEDENNSEEF